MHYIRFLSPPKIAQGVKTSLIVTAVVAVTTDLGDDFLAHDILLKARLLDALNPDLVFESANATWQGHSRALKLSLQCPGKYGTRPARLHITSVDTATDLTQQLLPGVLDVWSAQFHLTDKQRAEPIVTRQLVLQNDSLLRIEEETGDSIARHIWDASLGFLQYFSDALHDNGQNSSGFRQLVSTKKTRPLQVIELGAGCGIVGVAFAQLVKSDVMLTDLSEATWIIERNIQLAALATGSSLKTKVLDWNDELDSSNTKVDLILVSDCIYNPDSSVYLVKTLQSLASASPSPLILVGYKQRHTADQIFFDCMQQAKFFISKSSSLLLPHRRSNFDDTVPTINFYEYRLSPSNQI